MIERANSVANIQSMLQTLRSLQTQVAGGAQGLMAPSALDVQGLHSTTRPGFAELVKGAVSQVNDAQLASRSLQAAYERGENVPLTDVVIGMQKSSLAFEATLQVRNKVLKAYEDILNMPV